MHDFHTLPGRYLNLGNNFLRKATTATTTTRYLYCTNAQRTWNDVWMKIIFVDKFIETLFDLFTFQPKFVNEINGIFRYGLVAVTMPRKDHNKQLVVLASVWMWFSILNDLDFRTASLAPRNVLSEYIKFALLLQFPFTLAHSLHLS